MTLRKRRCLRDDVLFQPAHKDHHFCSRGCSRADFEDWRRRTIYDSKGQFMNDAAGGMPDGLGFMGNPTAIRDHQRDVKQRVKQRRKSSV